MEIATKFQNVFLSQKLEINNPLVNDKLTVYPTSHYYYWFASVGALIYLTQTVLYTTSTLPNWSFLQLICIRFEFWVKIT